MVDRRSEMRAPVNRGSDRPVSLAQWVADVLAERIGEGYYNPGQHLAEIQLSTELGVSRSPIREAFRILEQDGLVVILPRKGATVVDFTPEMVDDVYQCRMHLTTLCIRLAVPNLVADDLDHLRSLLAEMEQAVSAGDVQGYLRPNRRFHSHLYWRPGNRTLEQFLRTLGRRVRRQRYVSLSLPSRVEASLRGHQKLMRALEARDAEEAGRISAQIIQEGWQALRAYLQSEQLDGQSPGKSTLRLQEKEG